MDRYKWKSAIIVVATLAWPFYNALKEIVTSTGPALVFAVAALIGAILSYLVTAAERAQNRPRWKYSHRAAAIASFLALTALLGLGLLLVRFPAGLVNPGQLARFEAEPAVQAADRTSAAAPASSAKPTLADLYREANPELVVRAMEIVDHRAQAQPDGGVTLIIGPAGAGKTFLVPLLQSLLPESQVVRLKKGEREDVRWEDKSQLRYLAPGDKEVAISRMPHVAGDRDTVWKSLIKLPGDKPPPFLIIDDTDEVHPDTMDALLTTIEQQLTAQAKGGPACHMFLLGRPEAFRDFMTKPSRPSQFSDVVSVVGPSYDTSQSLEVLIHAAAVFRVVGKKGDSQLTPKEKREIEAFAAKVSRNLPVLLAQHPWLRSTIRNLELANFVCERAAATSQWDEYKLKGLIVGRMFDRARATHGRPAGADERYFNWFSEIAARHPLEIAQDGRPSFPVDPHQDRLHVGDGNAQVYAHEVLDYSGMAFLHPIRDSQRHYSFEPLWLHRYFVELNNQRIDERCVPGRYDWYCLERIALGVQPLLGFALIVTVASVGVRCLGPRAVDKAIDVAASLLGKQKGA